MIYTCIYIYRQLHTDSKEIQKIEETYIYIE